MKEMDKMSILFFEYYQICLHTFKVLYVVTNVMLKEDFLPNYVHTLQVRILFILCKFMCSTKLITN